MNQFPLLAAQLGAARLGQIGEFRPSPEADSKQFNVKVDRRPYTGTKYTLEKMAAYVKDGSVSPSMRQFAEMVVRNAGVAPSEKLTNRRAASIFLGYVKDNARYRPDPDQVEMVQSPHITLCVPGATMCIPVGDCDDLCVALGSLMGAYGIPVRIMKQTFNDDDSEEHVLIIFQTDDGAWLAADPSAPASAGIGFKATASSEVIIDPLDPSGSGTQASEYVGIGKVRFTFSQSGPIQLPPRKVQIGTLGSGWLPTIIYPSTVRDAQAQLLAAANGVTSEVNACQGLDASTKDAWVLFLQTLTAFCNEDPGIWGLGSRMDRVESYQTELYAWQTSLHLLCTNVTPTTPEPEAPPKNGGPWVPVAQLGLYATLAVAGVYGLSLIVGPAMEVAKLGKGAAKHLHPAASEARRLVRRKRRTRR